MAWNRICKKLHEKQYRKILQFVGNYVILIIYVPCIVDRRFILQHIPKAIKEEIDMDQYIILADATCDLSAEVREAIGMKDYLPGHVHIDDGRDFPFTLDWNEISRDEFYKILSSKKHKVTTAPPNIAEYCEVFESYVKQGMAIISMSLSSKISSTHNIAGIAAAQVKETYPEARIYCFDTFRMSGAFGLLTVYAHILQSEGKSFEEVVDWLEAHKCAVH